jgi:hypothetical protein
MHRNTLRAVLLACVLGLLAPATTYAKSPKKYQVTGKVLEINDDTIVIQKDDEKWELAKEAATKVEGKLAVGSKLTIQYTMTAATIEVKEDKPAPAKATPKK